MPTLHINAAHISISQAYHFIAICYQFDHSIPLLYKNSHFTQHHFRIDLPPHRQHSSVVPHATILPVSSQLDLRFNSTELSKIIARAVLLSQLNCIFTQGINLNACCRNGIFKNRCSQFMLFDFIHRYSQSNGYTPKLRPTARLFPVSSTSHVLHIYNLQVVKRCLLFYMVLFQKELFCDSFV